MSHDHETYKLNQQILKDWFDEESSKSLMERYKGWPMHQGNIDLSLSPVCNECKGKGKKNDEKCNLCDGSGILLAKPNPSRIPQGVYMNPGQHLVFKNPLCPKGQMQIHMHPDDYEAFIKEQESKKQSK